MVARRGGIPVLAPALEEVPDVDSQAVASLLAQWRIDPFKIVIFKRAWVPAPCFRRPMRRV